MGKSAIIFFNVQTLFKVHFAQGTGVSFLLAAFCVLYEKCTVRVNLGKEGYSV